MSRRARPSAIDPGAAPPPDAPPHAARLVQRLLALEGPLIQLWAWPGSGANGVLRALCERLGAAAQPLVEASLRTPADWDAVLAAGRERGCRWYVALAPPEPGADELAHRLVPGERLVFAGWRRSGGPGLEVERTPPGEALLREAEVARLWEDRTGRPLAAEAARSLWAATDGWYRPLVEILLASGDEGPAFASPEELAEVPGVRSFLCHEVLARWSPEERERLTALALDPDPFGAGAPVALSLGLWIEDGGTFRLPRLLVEHLRRFAPADRASARPAPAAGSQQEAYSVNLFGAPEVYRKGSDGRQPVECRLRRSLQAFAFLASAPELRANRDELIAAIWPNEGERTIDRNFHPTLSHLRRALGGEGERGREPPILYRNGVYQLNPAVGWEIDTRELQALAERGRRKLLAMDLEGAAEDWRAAWRLYRGPFLQGFFDLWAAERRELFQQQYLELLRDLGDVCIRLDRAGEAMDAYRAVLVEDPLQERMHVAVMRLYAAQGRRDLVKRQYERLCNLLLEDLGVAPLTQTTEDYHRLMG